MPPIRSLQSAALFASAMLLSACATKGVASGPAPTDTEVHASAALLPFASDEGLARQGRARAKRGFAALANQFED
jgi:hypothetical protein